MDDDDFDYDEFVEREFGSPKSRIHPLWWVTALVLLIILGATLLEPFRRFF